MSIKSSGFSVVLRRSLRREGNGFGGLATTLHPSHRRCAANGYLLAILLISLSVSYHLRLLPDAPHTETTKKHTQVSVHIMPFCPS